MSTKPKMEIVVTSNTSGYQKGMREAKKELKDFESVSGTALSGLASAFGVNTRQVEQLVSAIGGAGQKIAQMATTGEQAFGSLLTSVKGLAAGIAGLGIAAAIAGFKALKAEADNFKSTIDGMNLSMGTSAYIATYRQFLHDVNSDTGQQVAESMSKWDKAWARFKANVGARFSLALSAEDGVDFRTTMRNFRQVRNEAEAAAEKAQSLGSVQADQLKEQLELNYRIKELDVEIAAARREASDKLASAAEREAARVRYEELVNEKYDKQRDLAQRMAATQQEIDDLAANSYEETKKTYELKGKVLDIDMARENELKAVDKLESAIANAAAANNAALKQRNAELDKILTKMSEINEADLFKDMRLFGQIERLDSSAITGQATTADTATIVVKPVLDKTAVLDLTSELENAITSIAGDMGELIGNLLTGGDAFGSFKDAALSTMADMAIAVGKIAISTGLAASGIKAALNLGNPYVAIIAGAALVALGAAVKAGLSNASTASASYGSSAVASSSYGSSAASSYERVVDVHVTGTLKANGSELVAVLNNEQNRRDYTT